MRKKPKDISNQLVWTRAGDHAAEGERLLAKNRSENGHLTGNPSIIVRKFPKGVFTLLAADSGWWQDEMLLHSEWRGPLKNDASFFDYLDNAGTRRDDA